MDADAAMLYFLAVFLIHGMVYAVGLGLTGLYDVSRVELSDESLTYGIAYFVLATGGASGLTALWYEYQAGLRRLAAEAAELS